MNRRLITLALGTFAIGTDAFVIAGILPQIAAALGVTVATAGQLITVFSLTYAILAPVMATVTARWPRRQLLLGGLVLFSGANIATAVLPSFELVLASRIVAAFGAALFTPTATAVAVTLARPEQRARALAIVLAGLSAASALGAPLGTLIGTATDWRGTIWLVVGLGSLAAFAVAALLPVVPSPPVIGLRQRLAVLTDTRVATVLLTTLLVLTGPYIVYTYISLAFGRATGGDGARLAALLFAFGVAATLGNLGAGYLTDRFGNRRVINLAGAVAAIDFLFLPFSSAHYGASFLAVIIWGLCVWGLLIAQQHRLVAIAPATAPALTSLNSAAIYFAVSLSGVSGAFALRWVGAERLGLITLGFLVLGLLMAELAQRLIRRREANVLPVAPPTVVVPLTIAAAGVATSVHAERRYGQIDHDAAG